MRRRIARISGSLTVALALAASALTSPTLAAKPAGATANAISQPGTVSAGNTAAFNLSFTNNGPSNISSLFLAADTPTDAQFVGTFNGPVLDTSPYGSCPNNAGTSLFCSFGAVNAGVGPITLTVVYVVPPTLDGDFTITFHYNSTGTTGGNSHGNDIAAPSGTVHVRNDANFAGRYAVNGNQLTISDGATLSKTNKQSTAIDASATGATLISLTAEDGPKVTPPPVTAGDICSSPSPVIGEWSAINVGDNTSFTNPFRVTMTIFQGPNPNQVTGLCWIYLDTVTNQVTGLFLSNPDSLCSDPNSPSSVPCFLLNKTGNNLQVVFISNHNGVLHLSP